MFSCGAHRQSPFYLLCENGKTTSFLRVGYQLLPSVQSALPEIAGRYDDSRFATRDSAAWSDRPRLGSWYVAQLTLTEVSSTTECKRAQILSYLYYHAWTLGNMAPVHFFDIAWKRSGKQTTARGFTGDRH